MQIEGTQVVVNGGKIVEVKAAGCATGTAVEVRQLFFNLPARRKFLRSEETERAHIQHYLTLAALAHPAVAFTFVQDGRLVWQLPSLKADAMKLLNALRERMRALYRAERRLIPVDFDGAFDFPLSSEMSAEEASNSNAVRVWGLIGAPGVSRATRDEQHLFVNRRPVENRGLNYALAEGYHTALMKGRYPVCCLFLEIYPAAVDVNIHPAKREVKFHNERAVRQAMTEAVRRTLLSYHTAGAKPTASTNKSPEAAPAKAPPRITEPEPTGVPTPFLP